MVDITLLLLGYDPRIEYQTNCSGGKMQLILEEFISITKYRGGSGAQTRGFFLVDKIHHSNALEFIE